MVMLRISERTRAALRQLAEERGEPMSRVVEELVEAARADQFFSAADHAYSRLREEPGAWQEELDERSAWEQASADGLPEE